MSLYRKNRPIAEMSTEALRGEADDYSGPYTRSALVAYVTKQRTQCDCDGVNCGGCPVHDAAPEIVEAVYEYEEGYLQILSDLGRAWEGSSCVRAVELVPSIIDMLLGEGVVLQAGGGLSR